MKEFLFSENEIPYEILSRFNLTREMMEDLPLHVTEDLLSGMHSPVLPVRVTDENGQEESTHTRLSLIRQEDGSVDVMFYPVLTHAPITQLSPDQQLLLNDGKAILADVETEDGRNTKAFVQLDHDTNQVLYAATPVIGRNLQLVANNYHLGAAEVKVIQMGEPLTFVENDEPLTLGIDLNSNNGIRFVRGDSEKWMEQSKRKWDKYTFGMYGCWEVGDDGYLKYTSENDYTQEMWDEQKKQGLRNASAHR